VLLFRVVIICLQGSGLYFLCNSNEKLVNNFDEITVEIMQSEVCYCDC